MKHNFNHLIAGYWAGVYSQAERVDLEDAVFSAITPYYVYFVLRCKR